jgi:hypothetical protein
MLLAVAVILGIVLLQQFDSDIDTGQVSANSSVDADSTTTTRKPTLTSLASTTTTTPQARPKADVKVLVANGSGVRGLAGTTSNALKNVGYATLPPVDANPASIDKTSIQYAEGYLAEAREVAQTVNQPATIVAPLSSPPVAAADLGDAKVVVVLGLDVATTSTSTGSGANTTTTSTTRR